MTPGFRITIPEPMAAMAIEIGDTFREHARMEMRCGNEWRLKCDAAAMLEKLGNGAFDSPQQAIDVLKSIVSIHNRIEANSELAGTYPELAVFFGMFGKEINDIKDQAVFFAGHWEQRKGRCR